MVNYDTTIPATPYDRGYDILIHYPDNGQLPSVDIVQGLAIKLADGTIRKLNDLPMISKQIDLENFGNDPIPLVHPDTGAIIAGQFTTLNQAMLVILACVRKFQTDPV